MKSGEMPTRPDKNFEDPSVQIDAEMERRKQARQTKLDGLGEGEKQPTSPDNLMEHLTGNKEEAGNSEREMDPEFMAACDELQAEIQAEIYQYPKDGFMAENDYMVGLSAKVSDILHDEQMSKWEMVDAIAKIREELEGFRKGKNEDEGGKSELAKFFYESSPAEIYQAWKSGRYTYAELEQVVDAGQLVTANVKWKELLTPEDWKKIKKEKGEGGKVEDNANEIGEKIKAAEEEVKNLRDVYASKYYEATTLLTKIKNMFSGKARDAHEVDTVNDAFNNYKAKMNELASLKLEELKNKGLAEEELKKEMGDLIKYVNYDEKINLREAKTNARAKAREGKFGEMFLKLSSKAINSYRKMPAKYKYALAGTLLVGGGGLAIPLAMAGFSTASLGILGTSIFAKSAAASTILAGYRAFSGAATGTGVAGAMEARYSQKELKKAEAEKDYIVAHFENSEQKFTAIMEKLQSEIDTYQSSLMQDEKKAWQRNAIGLGVGVILGSGAMSWGLRKVANYLGWGTTGGGFNRNNPDEYFAKQAEAAQGMSGGKTGVPDMLGSDGKIPGNLEGKGLGYYEQNEFPKGEFPQGEVSPTGGAGAAVEAVEKINVPEITVAEGSSLEGSLAKYISTHPDLLEKYNQLQGGRSFNAGQAAHRMALEYLQPQNPGDLSRHLIHPDATVDIDPDTMKIVEIRDPAGMGYSPESHAASEIDKSAVNPDAVKAPETPQNIPDNPPGEKPVTKDLPWQKDVPEHFEAHEFTRGEITQTLFDKYHMWSGDYDKISSMRVGSFTHLGPYATPGGEYLPGEDYNYNEISGFQRDLKGFYSHLGPAEQAAVDKMSVDEFTKKYYLDFFEGHGAGSAPEAVNNVPNAAETVAQPASTTEEAGRVVKEAAVQQAESHIVYPESVQKLGNSWVELKATPESLRALAKKPAIGGAWESLATKDGKVIKVAGGYEAKMAAIHALKKMFGKDVV